jgi:hypothetical protein
MRSLHAFPFPDCGWRKEEVQSEVWLADLPDIMTAAGKRSDTVLNMH